LTSDDLDSHRPSRSSNGSHGCFDVGGVEVANLEFGKLTKFGFGDLADLDLVWLFGYDPGFLTVASPAAFFKRTAAGGVLRMKEKDRSA
jgi:hypothetical protein